ncbi:hypothetical protein C8F01DRAFT_1275975 [Mycena amicta]|nr:hypothetical protein C8F01DRAFT_1275975 [Mycena amicta]
MIPPTSDSQFPSDTERGRVDIALREMNCFSIPLGSTTVEEFCRWIRDKAAATVVASPITDISWWEAQAGLKDQVILLRFEHVREGSHVCQYYIELERVGRTTCNQRTIDKATFSRQVETLRIPEGHRLFIALVRKEVSEFLRGINARVMPAFQEFSDHKWHGPPPTLKDLADYLRVIVARQPNYTLWSSNCFWFSRHIMHLIILRHYTFPFVAFTTDTTKFCIPRTLTTVNADASGIKEDEWRAYDPSSIGLLFRFLHYEEWRNGILIFRRLVIIIFFLLSCGMAAVQGYAAYVFLRDQTDPDTRFQSFAVVKRSGRGEPAAASLTKALNVGLASLFVILFVLPLYYMATRPLICWGIWFLTRLGIRRSTALLVRLLERDDNNPAAARGDFIPPEIPLYVVLFPSFRPGSHRRQGIQKQTLVLFG